MRILHVTDTFLPRLGGIELHVADLAQRQAAAGHDVLVLTAERHVGEGAYRAGVTVERLRVGPLGIGIGVALGPVVASFAPDLIHAHLTVGSPFAWAVLRSTAGIPAVATVHSLLPESARLIRAAARLIGLPTERMTFTAVSAVAARPLCTALGPETRVMVLHNGIDAGEWAVEHRPTGQFHVVAVGRLAARKRPLVLVDALARLAEAAPDLDWSATIVGDGAQRRKVAESIHARGLADRIRLPGALSRTEIRDLLATADVLAAPAVLESFGIAALEARCAGVPVVGMAASGVAEFVVHEVDGLLAQTDAELGECLLRLARDPKLIDQIREHNATTGVPMSWDVVVAEHDLVYDTALQRSPVRASSFDAVA